MAHPQVFPPQVSSLEWRAAGGVLLSLSLLVGGCTESELDAVNHMPVVQSVTYTPTEVLAGGREIILRVEATDEDGDNLSYFWTASAGALDQVTGPAVTWTTPVFGGEYQVLVTVSDGQAAVTSSTPLRVLADQFSGDVRVTSVPTGATIVVDGHDTGFRTPHTFGLDAGTGQDGRLTVGTHDFTIVAEDCSEFTDTECLTFPTETAINVPENEDIVITLRFVTVKRKSPTPGPGVTLSPPRLDAGGALIFWCDDVLGSSKLVRAGVDSEPGDAERFETLIGYDDEAFNPNWRNFDIFFQSALADTGSRVHSVDADGFGTVRTYDLGGDARNPAFTVSGARMAWVRNEREGSLYRTSLMETTDDPAGGSITAAVLVSHESTAGRPSLSTPVYSSTEDWILYSVTQPTGESDLYLYDLDAAVERRLTTTGDRVWPAFGFGQEMVFWEATDGTGIYGAPLDPTTWTLGAPMRLARSGAGRPAFGRDPLGGGTSRLVFLTDEGVHLAQDFDDTP
jgi:hypothetical protein